jgi:hypothetical protein
MVGVSWISSMLEKFRKRTFCSSLLNFLAIRTNSPVFIIVRVVRTEIRRTEKVGSPLIKTVLNKIKENH